MIKKYWKNSQGQGMSEYLILVMLIAVGSIAATQSLGTTVFKKLKQIQQKVQDVNFTDVQNEK
jgi:Flp pilus assembly pilin Flp